MLYGNVTRRRLRGVDDGRRRIYGNWGNGVLTDSAIGGLRMKPTILRHGKNYFMGEDAMCPECGGTEIYLKEDYSIGNVNRDVLFYCEKCFCLWGYEVGEANDNI